jgi:hypothetical protein
MDSLDYNSKFTSMKITNTFPWQNDLQLNLETWRQVLKYGDIEQVLIKRKPLKLNFDYLQIYVEKTKNSLKKRSQHDLLLNRTPSS